MFGRFRVDPEDISFDFQTSYRFGQLTGDTASMVTGAAEIGFGEGLSGAGVLATPATGGTSLTAVPAGQAVVGHGTSAVTLGAKNTAGSIKGLYDSFAKKGHSGNGGSLDSQYTGKTSEEIISKHRKGSVREVFPDELLSKTWEEIKKGAAAGKKVYRTAKKLLTDGRFKK